MHFGDYELLNQTGADSGGVRYQVRCPDGRLAELRVLQQNDRSLTVWNRLLKRLKIIRLIRHPGIRQVIDLADQQQPQYLVVASPPARLLRNVVGEKWPLSRELLISWSVQLTTALAMAHRMGVAHGELSVDSVGLSEAGGPEVDLTQAQTVPMSGNLTAAAMADDVASCGQLLDLLLTLLLRESSGSPEFAADGEFTQQLHSYIAQLRHTDPEQRPAMADVAAWFGSQALRLSAESRNCEVPLLSGSAVADSEVADGQSLRMVRLVNSGDLLGRFRLLQELGHGAMGTVYLARDEADGTACALKVLNPESSGQAESVQRFRREARLLGELNNPFITNLIEFNQDQGVCYFVMEYVRGRTLRQLLAEQQRLDERTAVGIMADVCRALVDAHGRGIVHRDVKPDNILLLESAAPKPRANGGAAQDQLQLKIKLSDFGLARREAGDEDLELTETGKILGTPLYMSPEQCEDSRAVDARSDVYSIGATLFHLLSGRPPFVAGSFAALIRLHAEESAPWLKSVVEELTEAVCGIVDCALAKQPERRFRNAAEMLTALDELLHGTTTSAAARPAPADTTGSPVLTYSWSWELTSTPAELWPWVSSTDRLNRAAGLPAVQFSDLRGPTGRPERFGQVTFGGIRFRWREHPFEWVEGQRFSVVREYTDGPFQRLCSTVELHSSGRGTRLQHTVQVSCRGFLGRLLASALIRFRTRTAFEKVYRRIDRSLAAGELSPARRVRFQDPQRLTRRQWQRLESQLSRLRDAGVASSLVQELGDFLSEADPQEVARIRPLALARQLKFEENQLLRACLIAAHNGLLRIAWELRCPVCRVTAEAHRTLEAVRNHGFCPACNLDFDVDPGESLELVFRVHEAVRSVDTQTYCVGGPAHLPHVLVNLRLRGGERLCLDLQWPPGTYAIRHTGQRNVDQISIFGGAVADRCEWRQTRAGHYPEIELRSGQQQVILHNDSDREAAVRIERTRLRQDAVVAAKVLSSPVFRKLFPGEALASGTLYETASVSVLAAQHTASAPDSDTAAHRWHQIEQIVTRHDGVLTVFGDDHCLAVFPEALSAVQAAVRLLQSESGDPEQNSEAWRLAVHQGPARISGRQGRVDYSGPTVLLTRQLVELAPAASVLISDSVSSNSEVAGFIPSTGLDFRVHGSTLPDHPDLMLHCLMQATAKPHSMAGTSH